MADILCITSGLSGILYSSLELARRLEASGHRLTYAAPAAAAHTVQAHGLRYLELPPSTYAEFLATDGQLSTVAKWGSLEARRKSALQTLALEALQDELRQRPQDLLLIDAELHEEIFVALGSRAHGAPVALLNSFVSIWRRRGLPPPHHQVVPGKGFFGSRPGLWLLWSQLAWRKTIRRRRQLLEQAGCDRVSLLHKLADRQGLRFAQEVDFDQWLMPFTMRRLPALTLHALEFEFPHAPRQGVAYVGPLVAAQRPDPRFDQEQGDQLTELLHSPADGRARPLIYAGFGSFLSTRSDLLQRLVEVMRRREDWQMVLSLGGQGQGGARPERGETEVPAFPVDVPGNVHCFSWVPQLEVLRRADVAVVHGGTNTADECVLAGVPMLVYCGHQTDMAGTTARVVFHGLGIAGGRRDQSTQIEQHLEHLMSKGEGYVDRVAAMGRCYERYRTERVLEHTINSLIEGRPLA